MLDLIFHFLSAPLVKGALYAAAAAVLVTALQRVFSRLKRRKNSVYMGFIQGILQAVIVIMAIVRIISLSQAAEKFYNTIILSSSLIVVVLGFIFQEGTKNIVHGFFISLYRPFEIGDWIDTTIDGKAIVGYVESMNLRHTVVRNFYNGSLDIIPNSVLDAALIENANSGTEATNSKTVEVRITYESDLAKAKALLSEAVLSHPDYVDTRPEGEKGKPLSVFVAELAAAGITLQARVNALTIEKCASACSEIREKIYYSFREAGVEIACEPLRLRGGVRLEQDGRRGKQPAADA